MASRNSSFSLDGQPEVFFSRTEISDAVRRAVKSGRARRLGPRLYTRNVTEAPEVVARRNWAPIAAGYFPESVISGRTALDFAPAEDGSVFLTAPTSREVRLPGLRLRARRGPGPHPSDTRWMGHDVFMSSRPRAFLENFESSRARGGAPTRTLRRPELEDALEEYGRLDSQNLNRLRDEARRVASDLELDSRVEALDELVGTLLGTRDAPLTSPQARAQAQGRPWDPQRLARFEALAAHLVRSGLPVRDAEPSHDISVFAFYEAYFSNYIEGTEFTIEEAQAIVFSGLVPDQRPEDAHDVLGTYRLVADGSERQRIPANAEELVAILRSQHREMLSQRPEVRPGDWKQRPNRVGGRMFVEPRLVEGTLRESFRIYATLPAGFARAAFAMFLVSEVHPFADGNGRMARVLMNSELTAADQQRITVRTRDRGDYLAALRGMTNSGNARAYVDLLAALQRSTADTDYSSLDAAQAVLAADQAFDETDDRIVMP